jgi:tetratricopeptide (TPR) repeat protein
MIYYIKNVFLNFNYKKFVLIGIFISMISIGCKDFVQSVEPPINSVNDDQLNSEDQMNFVITGVKGEMATLLGQLQVNSGGLSDELVFDRNIIGATYPSYDELETGKILFNNYNVEVTFSSLSRLRLMADTLVVRIGKVTFKDTSLRKKGLFAGNLYGGLARYYLGSYFGLEQEKGGATISSSKFIPSNELYKLSIEKFKNALIYAKNDWERKLVNSLIARVYLIDGQYSEAETSAKKGLQIGDESFVSLYSSTSPNDWLYAAGNGRTQFALDNRFKTYVDSDPKEVSRILFDEILGNDGKTKFLRQQRYPEDKTSLPVITWQENELMLAECYIRRSESGSALSAINNVRSSHTLDIRNATNIDSIYIERDKELYCTGNRLIDQRRFNKWHLQQLTWKYLPIPQTERTRNPNLK